MVRLWRGQWRERLAVVNGLAASTALAYGALRFDFVLQALDKVALPAFHAVTRHAYSDLIAANARLRASGRASAKHYQLFVVGLFVINSAVHVVARLAPSGSVSITSSSAGAAPRPWQWVWLWNSPSSNAGQEDALASTQLPSPRRCEAATERALWVQHVRRVASRLLVLVNGHVVGWTMCHAAIRCGFPTVVALKLLLELQVLALHLLVPTCRVSLASAKRRLAD